MKTAQYCKVETALKVPAGHIAIILPATDMAEREYDKKDGSKGRTMLLGQDTKDGFIAASLGNRFSGVSIDNAPSNFRVQASAIISAEKAESKVSKASAVKVA